MLKGEFRCRYCTDERHPGCHATCPKYAEDLAKFEEKKAKAKIEQGLNDYRNTVIARVADYNTKHKSNHSGVLKPTGK